MRPCSVSYCVFPLALGLGAGPVRAGEMQSEFRTAAIAVDRSVFAMDLNVTPSAVIAAPGYDRTGAGGHPSGHAARVEADGAVFAVEANVTVVSDYRARGVSASAGKPALQGEVALARRSGLVASVWASNTADNGGAGVEVDVFAGISRKLGPFRADLGVMAFLYPGAGDANYYEVQGELGFALGRAEMALHVDYGPRQRGLGGQDNLYVELSGEVPLGETPVALQGGIGIEHGYFGDRKIDWRLGATYTFRGFDLGVTYIDTARSFGTPGAGPTVIGSLGKSF
jgi:uncharacterized protein (TIGR02001 family)